MEKIYCSPGIVVKHKEYKLGQIVKVLNDKEVEVNFIISNQIIKVNIADIWEA